MYISWVIFLNLDFHCLVVNVIDRYTSEVIFIIIIIFTILLMSVTVVLLLISRREVG